MHGKLVLNFKMFLVTQSIIHSFLFTSVNWVKIELYATFFANLGSFAPSLEPYMVFESKWITATVNFVLSSRKHCCQF